MGVEFLQRIGRPIKVARDNDRMALVERNLFTRCLELAANCELLRLAPGAVLAPGDEVHIEYHGDRIVAVQVDRVVGTFDRPSQELRDMLAEYGMVGGRVDEVHASARVADIEITL
jgi:hypothetical protein